MIQVNAKIVDINITPKGEGDLPPEVEMATVNVELENPSTGSFGMTLPNSAMGGIAAGPCRVFIESA